MSQSSSRRGVAIIGAGVGIATAGVIALLVVTGESEPEERAPLARPAFTPPQLPKTLPDGPVVAATPVKPDVVAKTTPSAENDKARADAAAKQAADAKAKLDQARKASILGSKALQQGGAFASLTGTGDISSGFDDTIYGGLLGNEAGEMNGGFGYGRTGMKPGGGGTGWGTIGTGRYGTIGKGTGSGYGVGGGRGGMRGRSAAVPTVSIGQPTVVPTLANAADPGTLDKAIIRRYIKRNAQKIQYCYEKELLAKSTIKGTVQTQFTITESGAVATASASGVDPNVSSCVGGVIRGIQFPKPRGTGGVSVTYPFTFRPAP
jgi:hypothetical protein